MTNSESETSVRVSLRIRPQSAAEKIEMCRVCTHVADDHPQVILGKDKAFTYDHVFNMESRQPQIYDDTVRSLVEGCLEGYNATVLAYGQTGSGKTYTMGTGFDVDIEPEDEGIVPRAVTQLFDSIEQEKFAAKMNHKSPPQFSVGVQFMELYNEELVDLFDFENRGQKNGIKIHEDANGNIYTVGVTRRTVNSAQETLGALQQGALSRTTASTNMNAQSSRSHAIFTIHLTHNRVVKAMEDDSTPVNDKGISAPPEMETLTAKFNFVDLAGSERLKRTGATGDRAKEGISINCGLLALGNVISALGDVTKKGCHVPYRDSKLTRLLQDSLGGNSRTLMIACVSPSDRDFMETLNTLKYANRARNIKNKVVVNQDKASKQIAALRAEIQSLTVELMEYRQGRRVSSMSDQDCLSDLSQENNLLKTENDKLRFRIKALQHTIDNQSSRITDFASAQVLANFQGESDGEVEGLIQKYLKEIEELRNKLTESEAMAVAITRHAALKSRISTPAHLESSTNILEEARLDLAKQKQKAQRLEMGSAKASRDVDDQAGPDSKNVAEEDDELSDDDNNDDEEEEEDEEAEEGGEGENNDEEDDDDDEEDDDDIRDDMSEDLAELSTEISIKQKLIQELETSQKKIHALKTQYEDKLSLLQKKIKDTETERDQVLKSVKNQDEKADKIKEIRKEYEKKLTHLQSELKHLQSCKKEHSRLVRQKAQNEHQLRALQNDLSVLKKNKVQLMRQIKEEAAKNKQQEAKKNKEIAQLRKESRMQELAIRNMENEKRQKEKVLKRKEEEVNALKRLQRPISGQLGQQRTQQPAVNGVASSQQLRNQATRTAGGIPRPRPAGRRSATEHATRTAKKKWTIIDKKITSLVMQRQTVSNMEADMNRWIRDRDRVGKQLERCQRNNEDRARAGRDTAACQEQLEALSAHMDYIQENIADCQSTIMEIEEQGDDTTKVKDFISSSTPTEARILLECFLRKVIELGQESVGKEITIKEMEAKLDAMKQHNQLQQELLQHVLQASSSMEALNKADSGQELTALGMDAIMGSMTSLSSFKDEPTGGVNGVSKDNVEEKPRRDKARRRTGTQEEFLYPDRIKTRSQSALPLLEDRDEPDGSATAPALPLPCSPPDVSQELVQKVRELQNSMRAQADESDRLAPRIAAEDFPNGDGKTSRSHSLTTVQGPLPPSLVRGNVKSKSARNFNNTFLSRPALPQPLKRSRSQPNSPNLRRKALPDKDRGTATGSGESDGPKGPENVFDRLTGNLGVEADPDVGRMLPLRPPTGKPAALVCTYAATGHNSSVLAVDVTEDLMFTGSKDRTVKMWDLNTGEETASLGGHKREVVAVRFCPRTHCVFSASQNIIKVWDIREDPRRGMRTLAPPSSSSLGSLISNMTSDTQINDIKLGAGGTHLYAAVEKTVRIWDLNTNSMTGKLGGHTGIVMAAVVSQRNNNTVVYTGSRDHYVKVYEVNSARVGVQPATSNLEPPHYDGVQSLALHGNSLFSGSRDNSIKKWNVESRQLQQHLTGAHKDWVCALDFLSPQNVLLSGCRGGALKLWQMDTCNQICEIKAHKHPINAIATNSSCVFTASSDRLVRLWRVTGTLEEQLNELERAVQV